ncbi:citrate:proton symporter [Bacillus sp. AFS015896]|nr:citrate:proton symporter [Bacillus sp. AFS015896]
MAISFITYWRMDESSKTSQIEAELGGRDKLVNNKSS